MGFNSAFKGLISLAAVAYLVQLLKLKDISIYSTATVSFYILVSCSLNKSCTFCHPTNVYGHTSFQYHEMRYDNYNILTNKILKVELKRKTYIQKKTHIHRQFNNNTESKV